MRRMHRIARLATGVTVALALAGCSARSAPTGSGAAARNGLVFDGGIAELMPLHAGDWYVYRTTRSKRADALERSELSGTSNPGELRLTVIEGTSPIARSHLRVDADAVRVLSQMDLRHDIGVIYTPPLPLFISPVRELETVKSSVEVVRVSDGGVLDRGEVEVSISSRRDADSGDVISRVDRRMVVGAGTVPSTYTMRIQPGRGQMSTDNGYERRELVCARIGGKPFGTCP